MLGSPLAVRDLRLRLGMLMPRSLPGPQPYGQRRAQQAKGRFDASLDRKVNHQRKEEQQTDSDDGHDLGQLLPGRYVWHDWLPSARPALKHGYPAARASLNRPIRV